MMAVAPPASAALLYGNENAVAAIRTLDQGSAALAVARAARLYPAGRASRAGCSARARDGHPVDRDRCGGRAGGAADGWAAQVPGGARRGADRGACPGGVCAQPVQPVRIGADRAARLCAERASLLVVAVGGRCLDGNGNLAALPRGMGIRRKEASSGSRGNLHCRRRRAFALRRFALHRLQPLHAAGRARPARGAGRHPDGRCLQRLRPRAMAGSSCSVRAVHADLRHRCRHGAGDQSALLRHDPGDARVRHAPAAERALVLHSGHPRRVDFARRHVEHERTADDAGWPKPATCRHGPADGCIA